MILDSPITIDTGSGDPIILNEVDVFLIDHSSRKIVLARLHPALGPLVLWRGKEYDEIGDYTQLQAESKIKELLGANPNAGL
jgi:hypothetical protein